MINALDENGICSCSSSLFVPLLFVSKGAAIKDRRKHQEAQQQIATAISITKYSCDIA